MINCVWWVPETIFYVWRQSSRYFEENLLLTVSSNCMLSSLGMLRVLPEYLSLHHQLTEEIFGWDKDDDQWGEGCVVVAWGLQHWYIFFTDKKIQWNFGEFYSKWHQIGSVEGLQQNYLYTSDLQLGWGGWTQVRVALRLWWHIGFHWHKQ